MLKKISISIGILFCLISTAYAVQFGSSFIESTQYFDATVCDVDCTYSSVETAIETEGAGKSIYVKRGTYTETGDITLADDQYIYWDDVTISIDGYSMATAADVEGTVFVGKLTMTGSGTATNRRLITILGSYHDWSRCRVVISPSATGLTNGTANLKPVIITGYFSQVNVYFKDLAFESSNSLSLFSVSGNNNIIKFTADNITNTEDVVFYGVRLNGGPNYVDAMIDGMSSVAGNRAQCLSVAANDNTLMGVSKNCDLDNLQAGGLRNNYAALNYN